MHNFIYEIYRREDKSSCNLWKGGERQNETKLGKEKGSRGRMGGGRKTEDTQDYREIHYDI